MGEHHSTKPLTASVVSRWLRAAGHLPWNPGLGQAGFVVSDCGGTTVFFATASDQEPSSPEERPVALARYAATLLAHGCESQIWVYSASGSLRVRRAEVPRG